VKVGRLNVLSGIVFANCGVSVDLFFNCSKADMVFNCPNTDLVFNFPTSDLV